MSAVLLSPRERDPGGFEPSPLARETDEGLVLRVTGFRIPKRAPGNPPDCTGWARAFENSGYLQNADGVRQVLVSA